MKKPCSQCVRIQLAVPEAVHQLRNVPGLEILGAEGSVVEGRVDPATLRQLRSNRLVKTVEISAPARAAPEQLEPLAASLLNGLLELLHQPGVQVILLIAAVRLALGRPRVG